MIVESIIAHDNEIMINLNGLYRRCLRNWGIRAQQDMCQEECGELIVAINHERRHREASEAVLEEIVDVLFMCDEMIEAYGFSKDEIARGLRYKIIRVSELNTAWEKREEETAVRDVKGCEE